MNKQRYIENIIKIIHLELENYNMTAEYGYELSIEDVIREVRSSDKE